MNELRILFAIAICWAIGTAIASDKIPEESKHLVVKDGSVDSSGEQQNPSGPETNTGGGSETGDSGDNKVPDSGNNNESGDKNEDETTSQTTTSKASSHSQGIAFLLSSFFIAYSILH
ncbi:unnamed protein product [Hymenolepis diminuta]|uniref:Uncharacterized protein n=1 Tax=Hymenolepis diminuta TaxID=6216 RepID=A0A564Y0J5_HYMDI|nr:unnamed protein product [Hymenolepis diminuta]